MKLRIRDLEFSYKHGREVLKNIEMSIETNEILTILGPNGVGKTTLLRCINRLLDPQKGIIDVDGEDIQKMTKVNIAKRIGYVPQRAEVPHITVFDSMLLGRKPHITWDVSKKDIEITKDTIIRLDLAEHCLKYITEISGGELQKVQIGRALIQEPKIMLLDEPTSSLDLCNQHKIMSVLVNIVKNNDLSAIMTMHDINLSLRYSDKFLLIKDGEIFAAGGHEIITSENIEAVYGLPVEVTNHNGKPVIIAC
jgi:iron complex transport system ATP-binding protein